MSDIAIKIENLSKLYRLGEIGTGTLSHDLNRWFAKFKGKDDPFAKISRINHHKNNKISENEIWALKDINFEVKKGEVLGIIGKNGAGKSTLLKILSKITKPTSGEIKLNGKIASLLEVGTGFHQEMTGRENIFLNGAILGMTKAEIKRKFDEIVDFSGVEKFIDTPVKRYSSGMYVRLAFAVAAHLEPDILIVDEVLAVGDAEFQKKCIGKMKDVSEQEGRTVLFVSHNMSAIQNLCKNALLLNQGSVEMKSFTSEVIDNYIKNVISKNTKWTGKAGNESLIIYQTVIRSVNNNTNIYLDDEIEVGITLEITETLPSLVCGFNLISGFGYPILRANYNDYNNLETLTIGLHSLKFRIPPYFLAVGNYTVDFDIAIPFKKKINNNEISLSFGILAKSLVGNKYTIENSPMYNSQIRTNLFQEECLVKK